jgi:hypothetical protein
MSLSSLPLPLFPASQKMWPQLSLSVVPTTGENCSLRSAPNPQASGRRRRARSAGLGAITWCEICNVSMEGGDITARRRRIVTMVTDPEYLLAAFLLFVGLLIMLAAIADWLLDIRSAITRFFARRCDSGSAGGDGAARRPVAGASGRSRDLQGHGRHGDRRTGVLLALRRLVARAAAVGGRRGDRQSMD